MTTRRTFLQTSSMAALTALGRLAPRSRVSHLGSAVGRGVVRGTYQSGDPDLHMLAMRALDAAQSAGASYADVRFTVTTRRTFANVDPVTDHEVRALGVRVLANGAWGFRAMTDWTPDSVAALSRQAAQEAQASAWPNVPPIILGDRPPPATGSWQTPITRDPFTVPVDEVTAHIREAFGVAHELNSKGLTGLGINLTFERQDRTFASTDGAFVTQVIYTSLRGDLHADAYSSGIVVRGINARGTGCEYMVPSISPIGAGYEAVEAIGILEALPTWWETATVLADAPPLQTSGDCDVVFDAAAMASIVNGTFGIPLEYDRASGHEGNASLAPPDKILGTPWAPKDVTIMADRTMVGGAGTVRWDDEGVIPHPTPLVKDGVIVDYATNRASATELAPWYQRQGIQVQSNGCAASESALTLPLVHTPNLALHPGPDANTFDALVSGVDRGYAILGGDVTMDTHQRTGRGKGTQVYTIAHGKLGAPVANAVYTFKSHDVWRNLVALGGATTVAVRGLSSSKGHPNQVTLHTVRAVPAHVQKVRILPLPQA